MDEEGKSKIKHRPLPPGYVSFNELRERWLQKQQEERLKEEMLHAQLEKKKLEEEMQQERLLKKKLEEEIKQEQQKKKLEQKVIHARQNVNQKVVQNWKVVKQDGVTEVEESAKGKEIQNNREKKKKNKKKLRKEKQSLVGVEKENPRIGNECKIHEHDGELEQSNESLGGYIVSEVESKSGNEGNVSKVAGLPKNGGMEDSNVKVRGRFRRNGNNRVKPKDNHVEIPLGELGDEKGNGRKWRIKRNGGDRLKTNLAELDGLKVNELEINSEKLPDDEILSVGSKIVGINGNGPRGKGERDQREEFNDKSQYDDSVIEEKKVHRNGESEIVSMRFPNRRSNSVRNFGKQWVSSDVTAGNERAMVETNVGYNRSHVNIGRSDGWKPRQRNSQMVWVRKDENSGVHNTAEVGSTGILPVGSN